MSEPRTRSMRVAAALALALVLAGTGCGSRRSHEELMAAAGLAPGPAASQGGVADVGGGPGSGAGVLPGAGTPAVAAPPSGTAPPGAGTATAVTGGVASGAAAVPTAPLAAPVHGPAPSGPRSPVRVATVGTLSGPVGTVIGGLASGVQVWARYVNDHGGIDGHPVELDVVDDGGDSARHLAAVQQEIEQRHVVAFIGNPEAQSGQSSVGYITSKRVPVVGSDTAFDWMYSSPMYFPQAVSGIGLLYGGLVATAAQAVAAGKRRFGTITCVEGQICTDADRLYAAHAAQVGLDPVYRARASLAQPDFTAECLEARQAGVEVWQVVLDQNSVQRLSADCARQGYHPLYAIGGSIVSDQLRSDPDLDGIVGDLNVFPYFQDNTPATAEFAAAMHTYAPGLAYGESQATGWVAGKLFEKAAAGMPEPPSSEAVLRGLWSLRGETLGGLTQPLTFVANAPAPRNPVCMYDVIVRRGAWVSVDGFQLHCTTLPADFR